MVEDLRPIFPAVPGDLGRRVDLHRHNLGDTAALENDDEGTDTAALAAALLSSLDVSDDEGIPDICAWDNVGSSDGESAV